MLMPIIRLPKMVHNWFNNPYTINSGCCLMCCLILLNLNVENKINALLISAGIGLNKSLVPFHDSMPWGGSWDWIHNKTVFMPLVNMRSIFFNDELFQLKLMFPFRWKGRVSISVKRIHAYYIYINIDIFKYISVYPWKRVCNQTGTFVLLLAKL